MRVVLLAAAADDNTYRHPRGTTDRLRAIIEVWERPRIIVRLDEREGHVFVFVDPFAKNSLFHQLT